MVKTKVLRRKETDHDPKESTWCAKHGGGSVMVWASIAANETGSLVFIDDEAAKRSAKMNSEEYRTVLSASIQLNASKLIGRWWIMTLHMPWKQLKGFWKQVANPVEHVFFISLTEDKTLSRKTLKQSATEAWKSISRVESQILVMSMDSRLQAVINGKGFSSKL